jgi:hypothetical protein
MTLLESLIAQQVTDSVTITITRTTDRIAEEMAAEILREPGFREHMRALVAQAFARTLAGLAKDAPEP